jgi:hypothetical protein
MKEDMLSKCWQGNFKEMKVLEKKKFAVESTVTFKLILKRHDRYQVRLA